jgi:hypothetical protein
MRYAEGLAEETSAVDEATEPSSPALAAEPFVEQRD